MVAKILNEFHGCLGGENGKYIIGSHFSFISSRGYGSAILFKACTNFKTCILKPMSSWGPKGVSKTSIYILPLMVCMQQKHVFFIISF